jgi:hypothetical protein
VQLEVSASRPAPAKIRVRVPSWASGEMPVMINAKLAATGTPGTYVTFDRTWSNGDTISFTLPMKSKLTRYTGSDQVAGQARYALEYGPILMAAVGSNEAIIKVLKGSRPEDLIGQLGPKPDQPLHFTIAGNHGIEYMPYWEIDEQPFTCFPVIET